MQILCFNSRNVVRTLFLIKDSISHLTLANISYMWWCSWFFSHSFIIHNRTDKLYQIWYWLFWLIVFQLTKIRSIFTGIYPSVKTKALCVIHNNNRRQLTNCVMSSSAGFSLAPSLNYVWCGRKGKSKIVHFSLFFHYWNLKWKLKHTSFIINVLNVMFGSVFSFEWNLHQRWASLANHVMHYLFRQMCRLKMQC